MFVCCCLPNVLMLFLFVLQSIFKNSFHFPHYYPFHSTMIIFPDLSHLPSSSHLTQQLSTHLQSFSSPHSPSHRQPLLHSEPLNCTTWPVLSSPNSTLMTRPPLFTAASVLRALPFHRRRTAHPKLVICSETAFSSSS